MGNSFNFPLFHKDPLEYEVKFVSMEALGLSQFWTGTLSGIIATVIGGIILTIGTLAVRRISQRRLSKVQRLKVQLETHRVGRQNLGFIALRELGVTIFFTLIAGLIVHALFFNMTSNLLDLIIQNDKSLPIEINSIILKRNSLSTTFLIWMLALLFGPIRVIAMVTIFERWLDKHLVNRIQELEPGWLDPLRPV